MIVKQAKRARKGPTPRPVVERFWSHVEKTGDCWLWNGKERRAFFSVGSALDGNYARVHVARVAYELAAGPFPPELHILHTCDTPGCVRNDEAGVYVVEGRELPRWGHLALGTNADNMADMRAKGRSATGDRNGSRKHPERFPRGDQHYKRRQMVGVAS